MKYHRYAIYITPTGALGHFGAAWLGWDITTGHATNPPTIPNLPTDWQAITTTPRRYGFHATIKPPFQLARGQTETALLDAFQTLCATLAPVNLPGLELAQLGRFLALVPTGDTAALNALAAATVTQLDHFRAPLTDTDLARRRAATLTPNQDAMLTQWGYPYVLDEFRCHFTLSSKLPKAQATALHAALTPHIAPVLPSPFAIDTLSLCGEDASGHFHLIHKAALTA